MASVKISVDIEVDGERVRGFPIVRRFEPVDRESFDSSLATNATFVSIPSTGQIGSTQALFFQPIGAAMAFRLAGDGTAITLNKGGFVLVVDASGFTGTTVQNNSGSTAKAIGFLAGT
jgi:hypothetical protein